jgi:thioredoxin reductase (NADPH)
MSTIEQRRDQMFPKLRPEEIERLRQFGEVRRYKAGDLLFVTGEQSPGMFVLIVGTVAVSSRDGLGHVMPIVDEGPGQFLAEIGQLSGRPALVDARAKIDIEALLIPPEGLRRHDPQTREMKIMKSGMRTCAAVGFNPKYLHANPRN